MGELLFALFWVVVISVVASPLLAVPLVIIIYVFMNHTKENR